MKKIVSISVSTVLLLVMLASCKMATPVPKVNNRTTKAPGITTTLPGTTTTLPGTTKTTPGTTTTTPGTTTTTKGYKDGTYFGESSKRSDGYEAATVTISGGRITKIVLKRMNPDGTEVNYNYWTGVIAPDGKVRPNLKKFRIDFADAMLKAQSPDVNNITGVAESSEGWKQAVRNALNNAKKA